MYIQQGPNIINLDCIDYMNKYMSHEILFVFNEHERFFTFVSKEIRDQAFEKISKEIVTLHFPGE